MRLTRVFAKMQRAAAVQLRHWELSVAHFDVLVQTGLAEGLSQRELAERLLISKGNLSQLLDKMERDDLLARCREGRVNCLRLTTRRGTLYAEVLPARQEMVEATFAPLSAPIHPRVAPTSIGTVTCYLVASYRRTLPSWGTRTGVGASETSVPIPS